MKTERVRIDGTVQVESANGYRLSTRDVLVNLKERTMRSEKPVEGRTNIGTFAANELRADLGDRTITLEGDAKLRIVQGGLRGR